MTRLNRLAARGLMAAAIAVPLWGCGDSVGYTEYRVAPVKSQTELLRDRAEARQRANANKRGRVVDTGGKGVLYGE